MWEAENAVRGKKALQALIGGAEGCGKMVDVAATWRRCVLPNVCAQKMHLQGKRFLSPAHISHKIKKRKLKSRLNILSSYMLSAVGGEAPHLNKRIRPILAIMSFLQMHRL